MCLKWSSKRQIFFSCWVLPLSNVLNHLNYSVVYSQYQIITQQPCVDYDQNQANCRTLLKQVKLKVEFLWLFNGVHVKSLMFCVNGKLRENFNILSPGAVFSKQTSFWALLLWLTYTGNIPHHNLWPFWYFFSLNMLQVMQEEDNPPNT